MPDAHADTTPKFGPRALSSMATTPDAVFPRSAGIAKGDTLRGPRFSMRAISLSTVPMPPKALPIMTPTRSGCVAPPSLSSMCNCASSTAWRAAAIARCV